MLWIWWTAECNRGMLHAPRVLSPGNVSQRFRKDNAEAEPWMVGRVWGRRWSVLLGLHKCRLSAIAHDKDDNRSGLCHMNMNMMMLQCVKCKIGQIGRGTMTWSLGDFIKNGGSWPLFKRGQKPPSRVKSPHTGSHTVNRSSCTQEEKQHVAYTSQEVSLMQLTK